MNRQWIENIDWVIIYSKSHYYDEFIEVINFDSMLILPEKKIIELYQNGSYVGKLDFDDFVDWAQHFKGDDEWWEIDTDEFGIELQIKG